MAKEYSSVLEKLNATLGKNKPKGRIDFKELAEEKKRKFLKLQKGKNEIVFVNPKDAEDPFVLWGIHAGLQEVSYYSIPCDQENKNENCIVCNIIKDLQDEDYTKNKSIWQPIAQKLEYYAPVINVASEATIAEGLKWLRVSISIMNQLNEWIRNTDLEEGELYFYDDKAPQKVIINYDSTQAPATQYKLDKKNYKGFSESQLENWRNELKSISEFNYSKSTEETKKLVDGYLARVLADVDTDDEKEIEEEKKPETTKTESKLNSLRR